MKKNNILQEDAWRELRQLTKARIALGSAGKSMPLREVLKFRLAYAHARDAIFMNVKFEKLAVKLKDFKLPVYKVKSRVNSRDEYLKRPDLGKHLEEASKKQLAAADGIPDIAFIIADGLSAEAVNIHAIPFLKIIVPRLGNYKIVFVLAEQGRVAIGDEIGELLKARFTAVLIGERPGLSSPNSLGTYTTYNPHKGLTDESRNCISNIHEDGLDYDQASAILQYLIEQSFKEKISGVSLKINPDKRLP